MVSEAEPWRDKIIHSMKNMYVYILLCADDSYYVGVTNDIGRRLVEHEDGIHPKSYTFTRRPLQLVYIEYFTSPLAAIAREKQIKRWTRQKKEALIAQNIASLHELAACKNDSHYAIRNHPDKDKPS